LNEAKVTFRIFFTRSNQTQISALLVEKHTKDGEFHKREMHFGYFKPSAGNIAKKRAFEGVKKILRFLFREACKSEKSNFGRPFFEET
jgi:hypothetical protein